MKSGIFPSHKRNFDSLLAAIAIGRPSQFQQHTMYGQDMRSAAYRHIEAAESLYQTSRKDVAGYLFGIAAECAFKTMMLVSGMRPLPPEERRADPFYAHFQELKTMVRDNAKGRRATELRRYAENQSFMQHWDVAMRYSDGKDIKPGWINRWREDAKDIIGTMDS